MGRWGQASPGQRATTSWSGACLTPPPCWGWPMLPWPFLTLSLLQVIQKLVFPFSRMNYRPSNHGELFPKLEAILDQKAISSPLATVNILMSMFQLSHFPQCVLHQVFSPAFIANVMSTLGFCLGRPVAGSRAGGLGWEEQVQGCRGVQQRWVMGTVYVECE